jgi:hypothetical protein
MPMDLKKTFGYDKAKAADGVWVDLGNDTTIKIAKLGTNQYQLALMRHTRKHQAQLRSGYVDPELAADITANTLADAILLDWKNMMEDDKIIPYSRANAYRLLKEYADFRTLVEQYANDRDLFQDTLDLEADSKNSLPTSNGTLSTEGTSTPLLLTNTNNS